MVHKTCNLRVFYFSQWLYTGSSPVEKAIAFVFQSVQIGEYTSCLRIKILKQNAVSSIWFCGRILANKEFSLC